MRGAGRGPAPRSFWRRYSARPAAPRVMGIVNVTPDSFSDGGLFLDAERGDRPRARARRRGRRPARRRRRVDPARAPRRSTPAVELERIAPVVAALAGDGGAGPGGLDRHLEGGGRRGGARRRRRDRQRRHRAARRPRAGRRSAPSAAARSCSCTCWAARGRCRTTRATTTSSTRSARFLAERIEAAVAAGIDERRIWVDPGIGFGKTVEHNLELLRRLGELRELGRPIVSAPRASASSARSPAARSASGSAARSPRTCSRSPPAPTSSGSTTSPRRAQALDVAEVILGRARLARAALDAAAG